jgi:hypothetical protein
METKRIIITKNTNNQLTSIGIISDTNDNDALTIIMPTTEPNGDKGWIKQLHKKLLNKQFKWGGVAIVNTDIEESIYKKSLIGLTQQTKDHFLSCRDKLFNKLIPHVIDTNNTAIDIEHMVGDESDIITYVPLTKYLSPIGVIQNEYHNFREFTINNKINNLVFLVKRVNKSTKNSVDYGVAIYYIEQRRLLVTFNPEEFIKGLHGINAFSGELFVDDISDDVTPEYTNKINNKIHNRILSMETIDTEKNNRLCSLHL